MHTLINEINQDPEIQRRGRHYSAKIRFSSDDKTFEMSIEEGQILKIRELCEADVDLDTLTFTASSNTWKKFLTEIPPPGYHDLSAMIDCGNVSLSGNVLLWISNTLYVKAILDYLKPHFINEESFP